jgi:hypothetical protein
MVSALNGLGVKDMVRSLKDDMGFRADLWVVGAQNGECLSPSSSSSAAAAAAAAVFTHSSTEFVAPLNHM